MQSAITWCFSLLSVRLHIYNVFLSVKSCITSIYPQTKKMSNACVCNHLLTVQSKFNVHSLALSVQLRVCFLFFIAKPKIKTAPHEWLVLRHLLCKDIFLSRAVSTKRTCRVFWRFWRPKPFMKSRQRSFWRNSYFPYFRNTSRSSARQSNVRSLLFKFIVPPTYPEFQTFRVIGIFCKVLVAVFFSFRFSSAVH